MTLPASGAISLSQVNTELGLAATAQISLGDAQVRTLAGVASGAISMSNLHGKSSEYVLTLSASTNVNLADLFPAEVWGDANIKKRVVIPSGVEIGGTAISHALATSQSAYGEAGSWAGELRIENAGIISGCGGSSGRIGGTALLMTYPGKNGEALTVINTGTIRAGGGGGGRGGNGGNGSSTTTTTEREPPSGFLFKQASPRTCAAGAWGPQPGPALSMTGVYWDGVHLFVQNFQPNTSHAHGGWTYFSGASKANEGMGPYTILGLAEVRRERSATVTSTAPGGAGGGGGQGEGFGQARTSGSPGAAGGTNAGAGGKGGDGGLYGGSGAQGATGTNGNAANGTAGATGGLAGYYLNAANGGTINLTNSGTVQGRRNAAGT